MKSLIVNADDFGASHGINRGVMDAYQKGILTSASMMVDAAGSADAGRISARHPDLGVGLHVVISPSADAPEAEIERQVARFTELTGQLPTHVDSHHNVHRDARILPAFLGVAERHDLPLRDHCGVRHIAAFYGRWDDESHLDHISPSGFERIVATEVEDGFNELCCHPGHVDDELVSSYTAERQAELATLCDPGVAALLSERAIRLATFREVPPR
jgi:chitin disaccharide deacetylase